MCLGYINPCTVWIPHGGQMYSSSPFIAPCTFAFALRIRLDAASSHRLLLPLHSQSYTEWLKKRDSNNNSKIERLNGFQ